MSLSAAAVSPPHQRAPRGSLGSISLGETATLARPHVFLLFTRAFLHLSTFLLVLPLDGADLRLVFPGAAENTRRIYSHERTPKVRFNWSAD